MFRFKSFLAFSITILGSSLVGIMIVIDAIFFPLESDSEPTYYYFILLGCGLLTFFGIIISGYWRSRFTTSKKELFIPYFAFPISFVFILFLFINDDKHLVLGSIGFALLVVGLSSLLSTGIGLDKRIPVDRQETILYSAFPKEIKDEVKATIKWLKQNHQLKRIIISRTATAFYKVFGNVSIPSRVIFTSTKSIHKLSDTSKMVFWCLQTRNNDRKVREETLKWILNCDYPSWAVPFIIESSKDSFVEIVNTVYEALKDKPEQLIIDYYYNDLKAFRHDYNRTISFWNAYYREDYPSYKDFPGYKLFFECYGFKKRFNKNPNVLSLDALKWNKLWGLFKKNELDEPLSMLCCYYYDVIGKGHNYFFSHSNDYQSKYKLEDYVDKLKGILDDDLYNNLVAAYYSYQTRNQTRIFTKADAYFHDHQDAYEKLLKTYANNL